MRDDELEHLERLVDELIGLDSDGRAERLRALRASNEPGIDLVARLIAQHERHAGALATPPEAGQLPVGFDPWIDPLLGRRLGEFTLLALIGSGGAGRVYEARQQAPERRVAIKVLATQALAGPAAQSRFRREANVLAALEHPAICRVYAAGAAPVGAIMVPYIAMEYVAGRPLDVAAATLDQAARLALMARIADAVHFAHSHGIVHRDLKPANILVVDAGSGLAPEPKILDFGIATLSAPDGSTMTAHTEAGQVLGTPAYASPEQLAGSGGDPRSDVYALGVMLFELLTGQPPFAANATLAGAVRTANEREAPLLRTVAPGLRGDLEAIVARALEVDPARRYPGAAALAEDLRRFATGEPVIARRPTIAYRAQRWLRRRRWAVGLASLLVVVAVIAGLALHAESESRQAVADTTYARRFEQYAGLLSEAVAAILADDPAGCRAVLDSIDPDLRGFEWRCVAAWSASAAEAKTVRRADGDPITHAERIELAEPRIHEPFCDLGNWDGATRTFELIDVRDRSAIVTLRDLPGRPWRFAVTPTHSHLLFSGMPEHALEVYDIATGRRVARLDGFNGEDNYLRVAPDGACCALAGNSGRVRFFSVPMLEPRSEWQMAGGVGGIDFSPDGTRVAITWAPDGLAVFSSRDGTRLCTCDTRQLQPIYTTFSDDGSRLIALNHRTDNLNLWDAATGRLLRRQPIPERPMSLLRIPGAGRVAVGVSDGGVRIFATGVGATGPWVPLLTLRATFSTVGWMSVARDGTALVALPDNGQFLRWQVPAVVR